MSFPPRAFGISTGTGFAFLDAYYNGISKTDNSAEVGTPAPDRTLIIAVLAARGSINGVPTSLEVDGSPATLVVGETNTNKASCSIWTKALPTGVEADDIEVEITIPGATAGTTRYTFAYVAAYGLQTVVDTATDKTSAYSIDLDVATGGYCIALAANSTDDSFGISGFVGADDFLLFGAPGTGCYVGELGPTTDNETLTITAGGDAEILVGASFL